MTTSSRQFISNPQRCNGHAAPRCLGNAPLIMCTNICLGFKHASAYR
jgi:hypothetical protein